MSDYIIASNNIASELDYDIHADGYLVDVPLLAEATDASGYVGTHKSSDDEIEDVFSFEGRKNAHEQEALSDGNMSLSSVSTDDGSLDDDIYNPDDLMASPEFTVTGLGEWAEGESLEIIAVAQPSPKTYVYTVEAHVSANYKFTITPAASDAYSYSITSIDDDSLVTSGGGQGNYSLNRFFYAGKYKVTISTARTETTSYSVSLIPDGGKAVNITINEFGGLNTKLHNKTWKVYEKDIKYYLPFSYTVSGITQADLDSGNYSISTVLSYDGRNYPSSFLSCDNILSISSYKMVDNFAVRQHTYTLSITVTCSDGTMYDVNGKPQPKITCSDSFSFTVDSISDANKYSSQTGGMTNENYNHCWIATAANMLVQQGYYKKGGEKELFDLLSQYYFYKNWHKSKGGYAKDIFAELLGKNSYRIYTDFNPLQIKAEMAFGPVNLWVVSVRKNSEGKYGSHVVTAYDIEFDNDKPVGIYFTDSDDISNQGKPAIHNYKIKYNAAVGYVLCGYAGGGWYINNSESAYALLPQSQTGLKLDITKVRKYIDEHEKKIKFIKGVISTISFGTISNNYVVSGAGNLSVEGNAQVSTVTVQSGGQLTAHSESSISNIIIDESGTVNLETNSTVGGSVDIYGGSLSVEGDVTATDAEVNFHISEITPTTESLSSGLNYLQGANYSIILDRFQEVGDYLLASDSIGMEQSFSIYGETLVGVRGTSGSTVYDNPDFVDGYLGELNIGNTLQVGNVIYSLNYENNGDLVFSVSYTLDVDVTAPTIPGNFSATVENLTVTLDWTDSVDANGVSSYLICYSQDENLTDAEYVVSEISSSVIENLNIGRYYYQVCAIDNYGNFSDWSEVKEFTVNPLKKDLVASNLSLSQNCYDQEGLYRLNWDMTNTSATASTAGYSKIIISTDEVFDQYDTELAFVYTGALAAGETIADNQQILIPNRFLDGDYFIGFVADCGVDANTEYYYDYDNVTWLDFNASIPVISSNYGQLLTSRTWNQYSPWNDYCPYPTTDATSRCLLGCGPVAMSQVLYVLKAPKSLSFDSSDSYSYNGIAIDSSSSSLSFPSFGELNQLVSEIKYDGSDSDMAALGFAVAIKMNAKFGSSNTSTYTSSHVPFLLNDCNFDSTTSWESSGKTNSDGSWKQEYIEVIADNIKSGNPVILRLEDKETSTGHLTFIEDYDSSSNLFYVNMGWGGSSDGWYTLDNINDEYFTTDVILDIIPEYDGSVITVTSTDDYGVGTLRRAVELANSIKGANTIVVDPSLAGQTISLNSRLDITDQVTIVGLADSSVAINRNYDGYVFYLDSGAAGSRLSGMTIDGNARSSYLIYNYSSNNTFENLKFQNFTGTYGLYSYYYTATVDASSDFNGYSARGTITYVPDAVANANAIGRSSSIDFSWNAVRDKEDGTIMNYRLEYSLSSDMANASSATVSALSYRLANVSAGKNYYWRVCGIDSNGNKGIYSDVQRVYTGTDASAPTVVNGLNADVDDIRAALSWNAAQDSGSGISHYLLEYSEHNDFSDKNIISTQSTKYKLSGLKNNALYYWRVAAVDQEGNVGEYSQTDEFMPSADSLLISDKQNQTIETTRKLHITETGSCEIDGSDLDDSTYTYLVRATGYETELYIDGDLTLTDGRGGAYGIYGKNIVDGAIGGNISLNSDYEIPENGYLRYVYGLYASNLRLSEFSSTLGISSEAGILGYGLYVKDAFLRVNDFSGTITVDMEKTAYGIKAPREFYVNELKDTSALCVNSSNESAYGIYSYSYDDEGYGLSQSIRIDKLAGNISATSESDYAYGLYGYYSNAGSSLVDESISIEEWQGNVQASGEWVYGVYNNAYLYQDATGGISGKISIGNMTGSLKVNGQEYVYGFYDDVGGMEISNMGGLVLASSEERRVTAFDSESQGLLQGNITGTVIANSAYTSYAFYSYGGLDVSVSGTVVAGRFLADGETYESSANILKSYVDERQKTRSDATEMLRSLNRGYAFYSYGDKNDVISITDNALVVGDVNLRGGNDSLGIDTTAELVGDITTNGWLELSFSFTGITDNATISTSSLSTFQSSNSTMTVDIQSNKSGKQTLIRTTSKYSSWGDKIIGLKIGEAVLPIRVDGEAVTIGDKTVSLTWENSTDLVLHCITKPRNVLGTIQGLSWFSSSDCVVEYSQDNFATTIVVDSGTAGLDHYNVGEGTWQWRVRVKDGTVWSVGDDINIPSIETDPTVVHGNGNGVKDAFFVKAIGTWDSTYRARHMGVHGGWEGTGEKVVFGGENRFGDIFQGSSDENILLLTDDANGDALFAYDIYTESKDDLAKYQSRLANIKEIMAGAGNDIVDLTSDQFDYVGGGLSIHGGLGDDVIWANNGDNTLFGDAGNDRIVGAGGNDVIVGGAGNDSMHGGGGDDVFAFGGNWGNDSVEQLADGKVTLWFDDGDESKWDASTLTYRDGNKSVAVNGVTAENITLKFGDDGSEQYNKLLESGVFDEFSSERIFESKNTRGMLA